MIHKTTKHDGNKANETTMIILPPFHIGPFSLRGATPVANPTIGYTIEGLTLRALSSTIAEDSKEFLVVVPPFSFRLVYSLVRRTPRSSRVNSCKALELPKAAEVA
jgi:hypothetical protein